MCSWTGPPRPGVQGWSGPRWASFRQTASWSTRVELVDAERREHRLREQLGGIAADYDMSLLTAALAELVDHQRPVAADSVLVPLQCEYYPGGLEQLRERWCSCGTTSTRAFA